MKSKKDLRLYFLAIIPTEDICEEVMTMKQEVAEKFNSIGALRSPPHITLHMPLKWCQDQEGSLIDTLHQFQFGSYPFQMKLNGFGFFDSRVVFVSVEKDQTLTHLQRELATFVRRELKVVNADYKDHGFHPHMTIGFRDLKKNIFPEVRKYYKDELFKREFEVSKFCLLKHDGQKWHEFKYF